MKNFVFSQPLIKLDVKYFNCLFLIVDKPKPYEMPKDGIQIEVAIEGGIKRTAKEIDVEACMKRKLNLVRKQHQVCLHKVG